MSAIYSRCIYRSTIPWHIASNLKSPAGNIIPRGSTWWTNPRKPTPEKMAQEMEELPPTPPHWSIRPLTNAKFIPAPDGSSEEETHLNIHPTPYRPHPAKQAPPQNQEKCHPWMSTMRWQSNWNSPSLLIWLSQIQQRTAHTRKVHVTLLQCLQ